MENHGYLAGGEAARPQYPDRLARGWRHFWLKRPLRLRAMSFDQRLKAGVTIDPKTGCHVWNGSKKSGIYGAIHIPTHRLAWELATGPIPDGYSSCTSATTRRAATPTICTWARRPTTWPT
jgi:hypothetical protein